MILTKKHLALSLLLVPTFSYAMDHTLEPAAQQVDPYNHSDPAWHHYGRGKEIADILMTSSRSIVYDHRDSVIGGMLSTYQISPEKDAQLFKQYKAFYEGLYHGLHKYNNNQLALLVGQYAHRMTTQFSSMQDVAKYASIELSTSEALAIIEQKGSEAAQVYLQGLEAYSFSITDSQEFTRKVSLYATKIWETESLIEKLYHAHEQKDEVLFTYWRGFYEHFYRTIAHCNIKEYFVKALQHIDIAQLNIEQIEKLKALAKAMESYHASILDLAQKKLACPSMEAVIAHLDSFKKDTAHN